MKTSEFINEQISEATVIDQDTQVDDIMRYYDAARRGLGLANRLTDPTDRKKHRAAIMRNLNMCKAALMRMTTKVEQLEQEAEAI